VVKQKLTKPEDKSRSSWKPATPADQTHSPAPPQQAAPADAAQGILSLQRVLASIPGAFDQQQEPVQKQEQPNKTGLPDNLKSGLENISGIDMSATRVHRNSSKPANVGAHAYTQGSNIFLGPGQDKHLPHEAWHVVQQAQGRVKPTGTVAGLPLNDNKSLESEADRMGALASRMGT